MLSLLDWYSGAAMLCAAAGAVVSVALGLMKISYWIEAYPKRACTFAQRYATALFVLLFYVFGYLPTAVLVLVIVCTARSLWMPAFPRSSALSQCLHWICSIGVPMAAHMSLTLHYSAAQKAWAANRYAGAEVPQLPHATPHQVVAMLGGLIWFLPLWECIRHTTQNWSLSERT
ncbi:hypothetical protein MVES_000259 [Malassezia vespertilionis]|uniref:Uncharacterized protein n=1 Tax=Malassezia vespertilionis TaxID=2020962 RepID=A0A2N1JGR8_9BASI|nr:hypothetical protein MVES_000259 [Malassezia vespertilionis]